MLRNRVRRDYAVFRRNIEIPDTAAAQRNDKARVVAETTMENPNMENKIGMYDR